MYFMFFFSSLDPKPNFAEEQSRKKFFASSDNIDNDRLLREIINYELSKEDLSDLMSYGHQMEDMLIKCAFAGESCR